MAGGFDSEPNLEGTFRVATLNPDGTQRHNYREANLNESGNNEVIYLRSWRVGNGAASQSDPMGIKVLLFLVIISWSILIGLAYASNNRFEIGDNWSERVQQPLHNRLGAAPGSHLLLPA